MTALQAFFKQNLSLSIGQDARDAGEFRAYQLKSVIGVTPLMMAANAINAAIIAAAFSAKPFALLAYVWAAVIFLMAFTGFVFWKKSYQLPFPTRVSARTLRKVSRNSTFLGLIWGALPLIAYPGGDLPTKLICVAFVAGMMGGGCFALYMVPRAMAGYVLGLASTFAAALHISSGPGDVAVAALLVMYAGCLLIASMTIARTFASNRISEQRVEEQASIIGLLLKDFEESAGDWLWETDVDGRMTRGTQRFHMATGIEAELIETIAMLGVVKPLGERSDIAGKGVGEFLARVNARQPFSGHELHICKPGQEEVWILLSGKPLFGSDGQFAGFRGAASDITADKQSKERIAFLAHNDALTGLTNRTNFSQTVSRCLADRRVAAGAHFAVFYLDLDGFKLINDTKGHKAGDALLVEVGGRLKRALRENDVVARLGGDEFAILLRNDTSIPALSALAEKIIETVERPFEIEGQLNCVGVSIGIALGPKDGRDEQTLLNSADLALYRAKEDGKGTYRFFEVEMDDIVRDRRLLEQELRAAVKANEFQLYFQPLVSAVDDRTIGFEALIRWNHPTRGMVSPADFIPLAEKTGLISDIGDWVLLEACKTAKEWPAHMTISVNLSPQQFHNRRIVGATRKALYASGLEPHRLELEITEGLFVDNTEEALAALGELKQLGVMTALDDFGTGYSSLSYLLKFPFDKLKIDQSFIKSIEKDKTARDILETIARLGKILNLNVTAEGVENAGQAEFLSKMACNQMQGFHFGRPIPSIEIAGFLLSETGRFMDGVSASQNALSAVRKAG
ncbi:MAG: EAL domain-containing protein [Rhizobiaceae bacterium]